MRHPRRAAPRALPALAALLLLCGLAGAALTAPRLARPARAQEAGDDPLLLELAQRLLANSFLPSSLGGGSSSSVQLLPGALPSGLPIDLPLPPSSTLIGSEVRPSYATSSNVVLGPYNSGSATPAAAQTPSGENVAVVLDAPGAANDILSFYRDVMTAMGWTAPPPNAVPPFIGGFQASSAVLAPTETYCQSAAGPSLRVSARPADGGPLDVRLALDTGNAGSCSPPTFLQGIVPPDLGFGLLPSLTAPDGVAVQPTGTSGEGNGGAGSAAVATTDMSVDDLNAFYSQQLQEAGWTQTDSGASSALDWSTWSIPDKSDEQGFFYVRQGPAAGQLSLHVDVTSTNPNAPSSGIGSVVTLPASAPVTAPLEPLTPLPAATPGQ